MLILAIACFALAGWLLASVEISPLLFHILFIILLTALCSFGVYSEEV
jgi:hypothetical protein